MKTNPFDEENIKSKFSTQFAIVSFGIGTILLISYLGFPELGDTMLYIGFFIVLFLTVFNLLILINLIILFAKYPNHRIEVLIKILIVLSNIPIALYYNSIISNTFLKG
jgi:hypothetical protein